MDDLENTQDKDFSAFHKKPKYGFRIYLSILATIFVLSVSSSIVYYYVIFLPKANNEKLKLEKQKIANDQIEKYEENQKRASLDNDFSDCLKEADKLYWDIVETNGREIKPGIWSADSRIWDRASKVKQQKIDECYKLYKK